MKPKSTAPTQSPTLGLGASTNSLDTEFTHAVFAKSYLRGTGCNDAGTVVEPHDHFGLTGFYTLTDQPNRAPRAWYKRLFQPDPAPYQHFPAALASHVRQLAFMGGKLATTGSWFTTEAHSVTRMGIFYSPKLQWNQQDFLDNKQLEQIANNKGHATTRVRFVWLSTPENILSPHGYHVSSTSGLDQVPVHYMQLNKNTGYYEFYEPESTTPALIWLPENHNLSTALPSDTLPFPATISVQPLAQAPCSSMSLLPHFRDYILVYPQQAFEPIYIYLSR